MEGEMGYRSVISAAAAAGVFAAVSSAPVRVLSQERAATAPAKSKPGNWTAPKTPHGDPDLQGVWDFRTITPLERPKELAGKDVLSTQEAADFERQAAVRNNRDTNVPAGNVGDYNEFWYDRGRQVAGTKRSSLIVDPPDGRIPELTREAEAKRQALNEKRKGVQMDEPTPGGFVEDLGPGGLRVRCILGFNSGPPMTPSAYNNNVQIFQAPGYVVLLNEMVHDSRIIPLDGRPHGKIRQWAGDSRGRWEGDTLVVETVNFHRPTLMTTGETSATMHLTERFRRTAADTLVYEFTINDPQTWTKPWTAQVPWSRSDERMYEYACHEGNYGLYNILAGAPAPDAKK
jgi:hypothetical protein